MIGWEHFTGYGTWNVPATLVERVVMSEVGGDGTRERACDVERLPRALVGVDISVDNRDGCERRFLFVYSKFDPSIDRSLVLSHTF